MRKFIFHFLALLLFAIPSKTWSQVDRTPPGSESPKPTLDKDAEEEEEDEEDAAWEAKPGKVAVAKYAEATIHVDGKEWKIGPEFIAKRSASMAIHIDRLLPDSFVRLEPAVAGIEFKTRRFQANELGILDLGVETGNKKGQGNLKFTYTPSNGVEKVISVKLKLE